MKMSIDFPGYILFEGLDLTGKTSVANTVIDLINSKKKVSVGYMHGFFSNTNHEQIANIVASLSPREKEDFFINLYLKDKRVPIRNFNSIQIVDRYFPSIIFYGYVRNGTPIDKYSFQESFLLPRHVVLFESDYQSKQKRFSNRIGMNSLEKIMLESKSLHDNFVAVYRKIIELMDVPFSTIDTSSLTLNEVTQQVLDALNERNALVDKLNVSELMADTRYVLHASRVEKYYQRLRKGLKTNPPIVLKTRKGSKILYLIEDGRHRAMAYHLLGFKEIQAYLHYENETYVKSENILPLTDLVMT